LKQVMATIFSNIELMPGVYLIEAIAPEIAATAKPGQFVMINCGAGTILQRPFSIHKVIDSSRILILFSITRRGTYWLSHLQKGEHLNLLGPLGNGFSIKPASKQLLLIAGGIGIAPLVFLASEALAIGKEAVLLMGAPAASQLYPQQLLPFEIQITRATEDGSAGIKGMITDLLSDYLDRIDQIFACGPIPMYQTISKLLLKRSFKKPAQISLETRMGCGIGACYGCSIKTTQGMKMVCRDGPVFNIEEIIWEGIRI
jgi:dihydroorotate dehydrogenase electron transfer subunit